MSGNNGAERLRSLVERIEQLHAERDELAAHISDIFKEAKGEGWDTRIMRKVIAERRKDEATRAAEQEVFAMYWDEIHQLNLFEKKSGDGDRVGIAG
jgi:uncharacterized protein (UPF0335 family)